MPNRLAEETSPYLKQHAENPIDWYPWCEEAFKKAKKEDKPILLSIGYSACHWCHVMKIESFEDLETAKIMNEYFVCIKIDREERPDLDSIYMEAVQALTGQGGWPLNVFLTPDGLPFYGGTYFPSEDRLNIPSFKKVLTAVIEAYKKRRQDIDKNARTMYETLNRKVVPSTAAELTSSIIDDTFLRLTYLYDKTNGGFGGAPKFPQPSILQLLIIIGLKQDFTFATKMVENTLSMMAKGGIYDHLGGGFHRYSVDSKWLIPHFEKMLYDNAQLSLVYLHTYQITKNPYYRRVMEEILNYIVREMRHPHGGFYSSQDADTEGEEGKYYLWSRREISAVLDEKETEIFCKVYGITEEGNFEGRNILNVQTDIEGISVSSGIPGDELMEILERARKKLFETRGSRMKPAKDEKVLTSWNGLMLKSFAEAARVLKRDDYMVIAEENAKFIVNNLFVDGRLKHTWKDGNARFNGFLEDYAFYADGLLSLYQTTFNPTWFKKAYAFADILLERFSDKKSGGFYDTSDDHETLISRPKNFFDHAVPSGGSIASNVLLTLYGYTGEKHFRDTVEKALKSEAPFFQHQPTAVCNWLQVLNLYLSSPLEVALCGKLSSEDLEKMLSIVFEPYWPNIIVALQPIGCDYSDLIPILKGKTPINGRATAFVCKNFVCNKQITEPDVLLRQLTKTLQ